MTEQKFRQHPAADIFPPMSDGEFRSLKADIAKNGLREPIVTYQDQILDGRHRYRACMELGVLPDFRQYRGNDPVGYVVSVNLHRRQLNPSQRALIVAQAADAKPGGDRRKPQKCGLTHSQAALQANVSPRLVEKASALLKAENEGRAIPELLKAVREMRLGRAEEISRVPRDQQGEAMAHKTKGTPRRGRAGNRREQWALRLKTKASEVEGLSLEIKQLTAHAQVVGNLKPEDRKSLVETYRCAAQVLTKVAEHLEQVTPQGLDAVLVAQEAGAKYLEEVPGQGPDLGAVIEGTADRLEQVAPQDPNAAPAVEVDRAERLEGMAPQVGATPVVEDEVDLD